MMQLNCLPLRDQGMADWILNQDILYGAVLARCSTLLFAMDPLFGGTNKKPVKDIKKTAYDKKTQRGHPVTSLFSVDQEVFSTFGAGPCSACAAIYSCSISKDVFLKTG